MNTVIISFGSNIDAEANIAQMIELLKKDVEIIQLSSMLKTNPIGIEDQPEFTNGAVKIKTNFNQADLTKYLKNIEDLLGRDRSLPKFGPRCIDLDILVFNNHLIDEDFHSRDFLRKSAKELGFEPY